MSVPYVDFDENKIPEDFLIFVPAIDLTGQGLANLTILNLKLQNIDWQVLIDQGKMSGNLLSAQAFMRQEFLMAVYTHSLNIALWHIHVLPK